MRSRKTVILLVVLMGTCEFLGAEGRTSDSAQTTRIYVTGGLFGYFRLPDRQSINWIPSADNPDCPEPSRLEPLSQDAQVFINSYGPSARHGDFILLGTGDNFAPNYPARVFSDATIANHREKELYTWDLQHGGWTYYSEVSAAAREFERKGAGQIPTDNVGCFLSYAGYTAIVPGKLDFHYGPERLREMARFLAGIREVPSKFEPVQMLGSNIVIETNWATDHKPLSPSQKPRLEFRSEPVDDADLPYAVQFQDFTDSGSAYPWIKNVTIQVSPGKSAGFLPTLAALNQDYTFEFCGPLQKPDAVTQNCRALTAQDESGRVLTDIQRKQNKKQNDATHQIGDNNYFRVQLAAGGDLQPGSAYAICARHTGAQANGAEYPLYCKQFSTFVPFFEYSNPLLRPQDSRCGSGASARPGSPKRYVCKVLSDGSQVAVFGIVDQGMTEHIGEGNLEWAVYKNDRRDSKYRTRVAFADPEKALEQIQQEFDDENPNFRGLRILLAQMEPTTARAFASRLPGYLRFDVVVTQADDDEATPNQNLQFLPADTVEGNRVPNAIGNARPTAILVPPQHDRTAPDSANRYVLVREMAIGEDSYRLSGTVLQVPVNENRYATQIFNQIVQCAHIEEFGPNRLDPCRSLSSGTSSKSWDAPFQEIALSAIRKQHGADAAILQTRDIYAPILAEFLAQLPGCGAVDADLRPGAVMTCRRAIIANFQELMDRILWKGDFVTTFSVQGSILTKVLKQSKTYADQDKSCCVLVAEKGRGVAPLGISPGVENDSAIVNDASLDSNALYTIASSDFLALGDTGYPDLAIPPVGAAGSPITGEKLQMISSSVCRTFHDDIDDTIACSSDVEPYVPPDGSKNTYYDALTNARPVDPRAGLDWWKTLKLWSFFHGPLSPLKAPTPADLTVQRRRRWEVLADTLSVGFSGVAHTYDEATLTNLFGGVLDPQVNSKRSQSLSANAHAKANFYSTRLDLFIEPTLAYQRQTVYSATSGPSETQAFNTFGVDFGSYLHPWSKITPSKFVWEAYGHFETQIADPLTTLKSPAVTFKQGRTYLLLARTGPRWQNRKSFVDAGVEGGATINSVAAFSIFDSSGTTLLLTCQEASTSLQQCVTNSGLAIPASSIFDTTRHLLQRTGVYWNAGLNVPVSQTISYKLTEASDFFFNTAGDNSANTRYRHQLDQSLQFNIFPNLSFQPSITLFFYENKVAYNKLFQQVYSVRINYSFDWTNRHEWRTQFQYKKSGTTGQN